MFSCSLLLRCLFRFPCFPLCLHAFRFQLSLLDIGKPLSFLDCLVHIQCLPVNFHCFKLKLRKLADRHHIRTDLVHPALHLLFNLWQRNRCIQPLFIPDHIELHKALESDGCKQFFNLFPFCTLAAFINLSNLGVNQSDRFIDQSCDLLDLLLKLGVRLHADLLDTLPFVLESFFQLVQICPIRFHVLERILCVGDRLIVLYLLSNRSL